MSDITIYYPRLTDNGELNPNGKRLSAFLRDQLKDAEEGNRLDGLHPAMLRYYVLRTRQRFTPAQAFDAMPPEMQQELWKRYFFTLGAVEQEALNVAVMQAFQQEQDDMTDQKNTQRESAPITLGQATLQLQEDARRLAHFVNVPLLPGPYEDSSAWFERVKRNELQER